MSTTTTTPSYQQGVGEFYDEFSSGWESILGEHLHHGFYEPNKQASISDAQIRMIEEALNFAQVSDDLVLRPKNIVDVGCGIGGSSRYLAKKYGAKCKGITLGPVEVQRAHALAVTQGLADQVSFQVADALDQPFPDGQFDLVWSMESAEHMLDKTKFVEELARVAAPGATIIIIVCCLRDLSPSEDCLKPEEKDFLKRFDADIQGWCWCSAADYVKIAQSCSLEDIKTADWSDYAKPSLLAVERIVLSWKGLTSLLRAGWEAIQGILLLPLFIEGHDKGLLKYVIITCRKPELEVYGS